MPAHRKLNQPAEVPGSCVHLLRLGVSNIALGLNRPGLLRRTT